MQSEERQRVLSVLSEHIENGTTVDVGGIMRSPLADYACPNLLSQEQETFFRKSPLLMGLSTDLPKNGTYWADSATGIPILMVRDDEGTFKAFVNICRHRGAQVVPDGRGEKNRFSCPFHAWTYRNSGELIAINREASFGKVDKQTLPLRPLPAAEKYGMLWVMPSPGDELDVDACLGGMQEDMAGWQLPTHQFIASQRLDANINWKLAIDTFGENYHFDVLHKDTLANEIIGNLQTHDIFDKNYRMVFAYKRFEEIAKHIVDRREWPFRYMTLSVYFIYPNTIFLVDPIAVDVLRIFPLDGSPGRSKTHHSWYMNEDGRQFFEKNEISYEDHFTAFNNVIVNEDYYMASSTQVSASSGLQSEVIFGKNEPALHHYHNVHRQALGRELLELEV